MRDKYYHAYEERYRQIHSEGKQWASDAPSPIVLQTIEKYHLPKEAQLLEIGCGEGRDAAVLLRRGRRLLATDISEEAVRYCREKFPDFADHFAVLDCLEDRLEQQFDLIYAVSVLHMLVTDQDRGKFYRFIETHLEQRGIALICTMGDGTEEHCTGLLTENIVEQRRTGQSDDVSQVSRLPCKVISFAGLKKEIDSTGLQLLEIGSTSALPDFPQMIYAVVKKEEDVPCQKHR